jgi:selenocysteine-specific elongation factor
MTQRFDARLDFPVKKAGASLKALIVIRKKSYAAEVHEYPRGGAAGDGGWFARVSADLPFYLKWKEDFEVQTEARLPLGRGVVLHPESEDPKKLKSAKRLPMLELLSGDEKDMLLALADEKGFEGLREKDALALSNVEPERLEAAARKLEEEGKARILVFSPLFILSQESFEFLCRRIVEFLAQFHEKHSDARGAAVDKIAKRFDLSETVLQLALKHLLKAGEVQVLDDIVALASFKVPLSPQEEDILIEMEKMCFDGKFSTVTLDDIRRKFQISTKRLQTLLSLLTERKKIVQGKDGFYIHSRWLDEIVNELRESRKKELSVADFKTMTGLSRKFAIPLLELLDEMGVTKRRGPGREIL